MKNVILVLFMALFSCVSFAQERHLIDMTDRATGQSFSVVVADGTKSFVSLGDGEFNYAVEYLGGKINVYSVSFQGATIARDGKDIPDNALQLMESGDSKSSEFKKIGFSVKAKSLAKSEENRIERLIQEERFQTSGLPGATTAAKNLCSANVEIDGSSDCAGGAVGSKPVSALKCCVKCGETEVCADVVIHTCGSCSGP